MRVCRPKRGEEKRESTRMSASVWERASVGVRESGRQWGCVHWRKTLSPFAPLFICFFLSLRLPNVNWASHECCLFYLRSSLRSSDLPLFYFCQLFPSWSFSQWHSGLLFPISNYLTILINVLFLPDFFKNLSYFTNGNEDDNDDDDELMFI